jgi:transposase-like protein
MKNRLTVMTDISKTEDEEDAAGRVTRLTDQQWAEICELYETGTSGVVELADKFGVSRQNLSKRFKTEGVIRGSRAPSTASSEPEIERFSDNRGRWIEEARISGHNALKQANMLTRKIVIDNLKAGRPMAAVDEDLMAAQRYNKILVDNIAAHMKLLDAENYTDEEDLPELHVEDLTQEEILQHHKNTGALEEDATIEDMLQEAIDLGEIHDG